MIRAVVRVGQRVPHRRRRVTQTLVAALLVIVSVFAQSDAGAATPTHATGSTATVTRHDTQIGARARRAVEYAVARNITASIAVIDTRTGTELTAGPVTRLYSSASVSKVFVAVELLATGQMHGWKAATAWRMITLSDNTARDALLPYVGYADVYTAMARRYRIRIGAKSTHRNWTGDIQLTPVGMARFYQAVRRDTKVWPWLHNAMSHAQRYAAGGVPQFFGIPAAHPEGGFAIKQGWFADTYQGRSYAEANSTGYIEHNRYVIVILNTGPRDSYGDDPTSSYIGRTITHEARTLIRHGHM